MSSADAAGFDDLWDALLPIGRDPASGGYHRLGWQSADLTCREWFTEQAGRRGMDLECDRNGNLWAWRNPAAAGGAVVTGSHLDSVPDGGAYDGALGVVSAFAALDALAERGATPECPVAVVAFAEEEGARFGVPCLGSRLLTGALRPAAARALRDAEGVSFDEAARGAGVDPHALGAEPDRVARIRAFVELHVEQGRGLVHTGHAVGIGRGIRPHGRWRLEFRGAADHAGTTALADRHDPMLGFAQAVLDVRHAAARHGVVATIGRVNVRPNATNVIPAAVTAFLDVRGGEEEVVRSVLAEVIGRAERHGARDHVQVELVEESWSPAVSFPADAVARLQVALGPVPVLACGAGHDAGALAAAGVSSAMLFVRNPSGVSHAPGEHADHADCLAGVAALADAIAALGA